MRTSKKWLNKAYRMGKDFFLKNIFIPLALIIFLTPVVRAQEYPKPDKLQFHQGINESFTFNTGTIKGTLRKEGRSIGLEPVIYIPDNLTISAGEGLYNHYRVFTHGKRYGYGARRWTSSAQLLSDGRVKVLWPIAKDRPFELGAVYNIVSANSVDVVTFVKAQNKLEAFEVFLASYFSSGFNKSEVFANIENYNEKAPGFISAERELGDWLAFPRNAEAEKVINDGRWELEPHPLKWTMMSDFSFPLAIRSDTISGLTVLMMSKQLDCFGIFTPYGNEKHYSSYLSLFGYDVEKGEMASTYSRIVILKKPTEAEILDLAESFQKLTPEGLY